MDKKEILRWNQKYNIDHPWWTRREKELGEVFRKSREVTKRDLLELVEWKFKTVPQRKPRIIRLVEENSDSEIRSTTRAVFGLGLESDSYKVNSLCALHGVGPALASTILAFYDPVNYGVFDIHVWREFFGKEPENLFTPSNCLKLLTEMRKLSNKFQLNVRVVEKAHFKKNLDNS